MEILTIKEIKMVSGGMVSPDENGGRVIPVTHVVQEQGWGRYSINLLRKVVRTGINITPPPVRYMAEGAAGVAIAGTFGVGAGPVVVAAAIIGGELLTGLV